MLAQVAGRTLLQVELKQQPTGPATGAAGAGARPRRSLTYDGPLVVESFDPDAARRDPAARLSRDSSASSPIATTSPSGTADLTGVAEVRAAPPAALSRGRGSTSCRSTTRASTCPPCASSAAGQAGDRLDHPLAADGRRGAGRGRRPDRLRGVRCERALSSRSSWRCSAARPSRRTKRCRQLDTNYDSQLGRSLRSGPWRRHRQPRPNCATGARALLDLLRQRLPDPAR